MGPVQASGAGILVGGQSRRMGRDKALLELGGQTLLARCIAALSPIVDPILLVGGSPLQSAISGCRVIDDLYPGTGPVGGIVSALRALGPGTHLIVACDMPFIASAVVHLLLDMSTDEFDAVAPRLDGRPEPLCAVYNHSGLQPLESFLLHGGRRAGLALKEIRTRFVDESELRRADPELQSFVNLNTPDDVLRWQPS